MSLQTERHWFSEFAKRGKRGAVVITALFVVSGCARISAGTQVRSDGSFARTVVYRGAAPSPDSIQMAPTLDELIAPPRGAGWSFTREKDPKNEAEVILTATKSAAVGETISDDLAVKAPQKKDAPKGTPPVILLGNTVSVRKLPNGQLEYRELIRWRGTRPKELITPEPELLTSLAASLPPALASDRVALGAAALRIQRELWQALFGPGEPLLGLLISHPELGEFRLTKRLAESALGALAATYGEKLSTDARRAVASKIVAGLTKSVTQKTKKQVNAGPGGADESNNDPLVALLIKAKLPGKLIQSNGEQDPITGEVVWGLFSQAPAAGDITLTAVCEPGG